MKRAFENFVAWRLTAKRAGAAKAQPERDAWERWDGEGGNPGRPAARREPMRARRRRAARLFTL